MDNFEDIYQRICEETDKDAFLHARNENMPLWLTILAIFLGTLIIIIFPVWGGFIAGFALIFAVIYFFYRIVHPSEKKYQMSYQERYKFQIIGKLVKYYDENLYYHPYSGINDLVYQRAGYKTYNYFKSEDSIQGNLDGFIPVRISDILVESVSEEDETPYIIKIFEGLFASVDLKQSINSSIMVYKNTFLEDRVSIKTESNEFDKLFDIKADDKMLAMRILTSDVIDFIVSLKKEKNIEFDFTIINQELSIRMKCSKSFEPPKKKDFLNKNVLYEYYKRLDAMCSLIRKLSEIINSKEL